MSVCAAFSTLNLYGDAHRHGHGLANTCANARQKRWYACNGHSMWHRHKNKIEHHHIRSRRQHREISIHIYVYTTSYFFLFISCSDGAVTFSVSVDQSIVRNVHALLRLENVCNIWLVHVVVATIVVNGECTYECTRHINGEWRVEWN